MIQNSGPMLRPNQSYTIMNLGTDPSQKSTGSQGQKPPNRTLK